MDGKKVLQNSLGYLVVIRIASFIFSHANRKFLRFWIMIVLSQSLFGLNHDITQMSITEAKIVVIKKRHR